MRKGFTLIELLAVIVILAIIALIATPIVLNIINDTKESSLLRSAEFYLDAVETAVAQSTLNDKKLENKTYNILENGNLCMEYKDNECIDELEVKVSGEVPNSGSITIENGKIKDPQIVLNNKTMIKEDDKWYYPGLYDENDNLIATWDELVNDYGIDVEKNYGDNEPTAPGRVLASHEKLNKGVKLVIDSSVDQIGKCVFRDGTTLVEVIIPNSVISIGKYAFWGCTSLTEIIIPNSVISMGTSVFRICSSLKKVIISNHVTLIANGTFFGCSNLKEVVIPNSVKIIESYAFRACTSLKEITIPNSVISIGEDSFTGCSSLKRINYTGTEEEWNFISFGNNPIPYTATINYKNIIK